MFQANVTEMYGAHGSNVKLDCPTVHKTTNTIQKHYFKDQGYQYYTTSETSSIKATNTISVRKL